MQSLVDPVVSLHFAFLTPFTVITQHKPVEPESQVSPPTGSVRANTPVLTPATPIAARINPATKILKDFFIKKGLWFLLLLKIFGYSVHLNMSNEHFKMPEPVIISNRRITVFVYK